MMLMHFGAGKTSGDAKLPYYKIPLETVVVTNVNRAATPMPSLVRQATGRLAGGLSGLTGLDPGVSVGLVVLAVLGLGALGVSRVMKRRR